MSPKHEISRLVKQPRRLCHIRVRFRNPFRYRLRNHEMGDTRQHLAVPFSGLLIENVYLSLYYESMFCLRFELFSYTPLFTDWRWHGPPVSRSISHRCREKRTKDGASFVSLGFESLTNTAAARAARSLPVGGRHAHARR